MKFSIVGVAKIFVPVGLLALGINGLTDVGLQRDMAKKSILLHQEVTQAQSLSAQLPQGVAGLSQLQSITGNMQNSINQVQSTTSLMAEGLVSLAKEVTGINQAIATISGSVNISKNDVAEINQTEAQVLQTLQQLKSTNGDVVNHLGSMVSDEQSINQNLANINSKTRMIP